MNKNDRQQRTNLKFIELLEEELLQWCKMKNIEVSTSAFLAYMVKHNLIRQSVINNYVVINLYKETLANSKNKEEAIYKLTDLLPLENRQIKNILGNHYVKFSPNRFKFP
jgi:DNA-directed RNA polymerase subunit F